jgi:hypothetical protein
MLDSKKATMKIVKYIFLISGYLAVFSCTKVVDQVPSSIITPSNFYKTASDADNAINACYDVLQGLPGNLVLWGDGRSDLLASTSRSSSADLTVVSGNVSANGYAGWGSFYSGINRCNSVLKNVPGIQDASLDARRERILGEAYFLRGLFYFYLARIWENAPLILQPFEGLNADFYPRNSPRDSLFAQIESDFNNAASRVPDLPFTTTIENKGKANKGVIHAAMADLYLWEKKYQQAADTALAVINSPAKYSLVPGASYATLFTTKNTVESILEVQYNYANLEGTSSQQNNGNTYTFLPLGGSYTAGDWHYQPTTSLMNALPPTDARASITYKNTGPSPAPFRDANEIYIAKYPGTLVGTVLYWDNDFIIYRLAEVILFRAEALNELGQTGDAITLLNQVRTRAGLANTTALTQGDVRLAIENERFIELAYEGKRYFALVRTGRYAAVTGHTDPNWLRWPIDATELTNNPNLKQNPGY